MPEPYSVNFAFVDPFVEAYYDAQVERRQQVANQLRSQITPEMAENTAAVAELYPNLAPPVVAAAGMTMPALSPVLGQIANQQAELDTDNWAPINALEAVVRTGFLLFDTAWEEIVARPFRTLVAFGSTEFRPEELRAIERRAGLQPGFFGDRIDLDDLPTLQRIQEQGLIDGMEFAQAGKSLGELYRLAGESAGVRAIRELAAGRPVNVGSGFLPSSTMPTETQQYNEYVRQGIDPAAAEFMESQRLGRPIVQEARQQADYLQYEGTSISPGRVLANLLPVEQGSTAWHLLSGATDFAAQIYLDPVSKGLGKVNRLRALNRLFHGADEIATDIGLITPPGGWAARARPTIFRPSAEQVFTSSYLGREAVDVLNRMGPQDLSRAMALFGRNTPPRDVLRRILVDGEDAADVLLDGLRRGVVSPRNFVSRSLSSSLMDRAGLRGRTLSSMLGGQLGGEVGRVAGFRAGLRVNADRHPWARMFHEMPGSRLPLEDLDAGLVRFDEFMRSASFSPERRSEYLRRWIDLPEDARPDEAWSIVRDSLVEQSRNLRQFYIDGGMDPSIADSLARQAVNAFDSLDEFRKYATDAAGDVLLSPANDFDAILNGRGHANVSAQMLSEFLQAGIPLPDPRAMRHAQSKIRRWTLNSRFKDWILKDAANDPFGENALQRFGDVVMGRFWKPAVLLRVAWPIRVIGEEQARGAVAGLDTFFSHPLNAIGYMMSDPKGNFLQKAAGKLGIYSSDMGTTAEWLGSLVPRRGQLGILSQAGEEVTEEALYLGLSLERHAAMSRMSDLLLGDNNFRYRRAKWRSYYRDKPADGRAYATMWAGELRQLYMDEIAPLVAREGATWTKQYLRSGEGRRIVDRLSAGNPRMARALADTSPGGGLDTYVDSVWARIQVKAGADVEVVFDGSRVISPTNVPGDIVRAFREGEWQRISYRVRNTGQGPDAPGLTRPGGGGPITPEAANDYLNRVTTRAQRRGAEIRQKWGDKHPTTDDELARSLGFRDAEEAQFRMDNDYELFQQQVGYSTDDIALEAAMMEIPIRMSRGESPESIAADIAARFGHDAMGPSANQDIIDLIGTGHWRGTDMRQLEQAKGPFDQMIADLGKEYREVGPAVVKGPAGGKWKDTVGGPPDRLVDTMFDWMMSKPTNTLSRHPAFVQFYWQHAEEMLPFMNRQLQDKVLAAARAAKLPGKRIRALERVALDARRRNTHLIDYATERARQVERIRALPDYELLQVVRDNRTFELLDELGPTDEFIEAIKGSDEGLLALAELRRRIPPDMDARMVANAARSGSIKPSEVFENLVEFEIIRGQDQLDELLAVVDDEVAFKEAFNRLWDDAVTEYTAQAGADSAAALSEYMNTYRQFMWDLYEYLGPEDFLRHLTIEDADELTRMMKALDDRVQGITVFNQDATNEMRRALGRMMSEGFLGPTAGVRRGLSESDLVALGLPVVSTGTRAAWVSERIGGVRTIDGRLWEDWSELLNHANRRGWTRDQLAIYLGQKQGPSRLLRRRRPPGEDTGGVRLAGEEPPPPGRPIVFRQEPRREPWPRRDATGEGATRFAQNRPPSGSESLGGRGSMPPERPGGRGGRGPQRPGEGRLTPGRPADGPHRFYQPATPGTESRYRTPWVWQQMEKMEDDLAEVLSDPRLQTILDDADEYAIAAAEGASPSLISDLADADELLKVRAGREVKRLLYDTSKKHQLTDMLRNLMPFGEAWVELTTTWMRLLYENPRVWRRLQQGFEGAREGGFFSPDPTTGEEMFFYPDFFAKWIERQVFGENSAANMRLAGRVQGLNLIAGSFLPGFGPAIQIPASYVLENDFADDILADIASTFSGQEITGVQVRDWMQGQINPFGSQKLNLGDVSKVLPGYLRRMMAALGAGDPETTRLMQNTTIDVLKALMMEGRPFSTLADQEKLLEQAKQYSSKLTLIRSLAQFVAPTGPEMRFYAEDEKGQLWLYTSLATDYRDKLYNQFGGDDLQAFQWFIGTYGLDPTMFATPKTVQIEKRHTTREGDQWARDNEALFHAAPYTAYFAHPDAPDADFDYQAYLRQLESGARETLTPDQWLSRRNDTLGRILYDKARADADERMGKKDTEEKLKVLRQIRGFLVINYPGYMNPVPGAPEQPSTEAKIRELTEVWPDHPDLWGSEAGQALQYYLAAREQVMNLAEQQFGVMRQSWATAKVTEPLRAGMRRLAEKLGKDYPDFVHLYTLILSHEMVEDETTVDAETEESDVQKINELAGVP